MHTEDQMIDSAFGRWLREKRMKAGLAVIDCVRMCKLTDSRWMAIERGAKTYSVRKDEVREIAKVFSMEAETVRRLACGEMLAL